MSKQVLGRIEKAYRPLYTANGMLVIDNGLQRFTVIVRPYHWQEGFIVGGLFEGTITQTCNNIYLFLNDQALCYA